MYDLLCADYSKNVLFIDILQYLISILHDDALSRLIIILKWYLGSPAPLKGDAAEVQPTFQTRLREIRCIIVGTIQCFPGLIFKLYLNAWEREYAPYTHLICYLVNYYWKKMILLGCSQMSLWNETYLILQNNSQEVFCYTYANRKGVHDVSLISIHQTSLFIDISHCD